MVLQPNIIALIRDHCATSFMPPPVSDTMHTQSSLEKNYMHAPHAGSSTPRRVPTHRSASSQPTPALIPCSSTQAAARRRLPHSPARSAPRRSWRSSRAAPCAAAGPKRDRPRVWMAVRALRRAVAPTPAAISRTRACSSPSVMRRHVAAGAASSSTVVPRAQKVEMEHSTAYDRMSLHVAPSASAVCCCMHARLLRKSTTSPRTRRNPHQQRHVPADSCCFVCMHHTSCGCGVPSAANYCEKGQQSAVGSDRLMHSTAWRIRSGGEAGGWTGPLTPVSGRRPTGCRPTPTQNSEGDTTAA